MIILEICVCRVNVMYKLYSKIYISSRYTALKKNHNRILKSLFVFGFYKREKPMEPGNVWNLDNEYLFIILLQCSSTLFPFTCSSSSCPSPKQGTLSTFLLLQTLRTRTGLSQAMNVTRKWTKTCRKTCMSYVAGILIGCLQIHHYYIS